MVRLGLAECRERRDRVEGGIREGAGAIPVFIFQERFKVKVEVKVKVANVLPRDCCLCPTLPPPLPLNEE